MDLDGVVYRGDQAIPGSADFIGWLQRTRQTFLFLTNHSSRTLYNYAAKLARMEWWCAKNIHHFGDCDSSVPAARAPGKNSFSDR